MVRVGSFVIDRDPVYVGARTLRIISVTLLLLGVLALGYSAVVLGRSVAITSETVTVPVQLSEAATAAEAEQYRADRADRVGTGASLRADDEGITLSAIDPTRTEIMLSSAGDVLLGLAVGLSALLLRPFLTSIAEGHAFGANNSRRLWALAVITTAAPVLVPVVPRLATLSVLDRMGLTGADSPFLFGLSFSLTPVILFPLLFLVLAEAFRQGERLHRDVEGLV